MPGDPINELKDLVVTRLSFGWELSINADGDDKSAEILIEGSFTLGSEPQRPFVFVPGEWTSGEVTRVLSLLHRRITRIEITATGGLVISFQHGEKLTVLPGDEFEAWQVTAPGLEAYGLPGGEVGFSNRRTGQ